MDYQNLLKSEVAQEPAKAWRASGKKAVGHLCCHIPVEIFTALDILPVRLRATGCAESPEADAWMSTFSCSYARGMLQYWMDGHYDLDGLVTTDGCMMPARVYDNARYQTAHGVGKPDKFYMQIAAPRMLRTDVEKNYYISELKDLISNLEELSGNKLTDEKLKAAIDKHNEARQLVRKVYEASKADKPVLNGSDLLCVTMAYDDYPVDEYIEMLKALLAAMPTMKPVETGRARLMLIGSALDNPGYLKVIEDKGGLFVADALCTGYRQFAEDLTVKGDLLESIALYYLDRVMCPRMMDHHKRLQQMIVDTCKAMGVQGVIYEKMQYCECWGGESLYLEPMLKEIGIPMLQVEREEHLANAGQLAIRAEAFIEMIEG